MTHSTTPPTPYPEKIQSACALQALKFFQYTKQFTISFNNSATRQGMLTCRSSNKIINSIATIMVRNKHDL